MKFVEVDQKPALPAAQVMGRYRLGFANGSWLEIEGSFDALAVRELAGILREERC